MAADILATQGAKASAIMIFTLLNQINSVSAGKGLRYIDVGKWSNTKEQNTPSDIHCE